MLEEKDGLETSVSTLRRELFIAGLWEPKKKSIECRSHRTPPAGFGSLSSLTETAMAGLKAGAALLFNDDDR